jgi:hypothetical protein
MRVMLMIKGDPAPGAVPSAERLAAMDRHLRKQDCSSTWQGFFRAHRGDVSSSPGGAAPSSTGSFDEAKKLIAGYGILRVKSICDPEEWAKRATFEALSRIYPGEYSAEGEIEIRQVFEP